MRTPPGRGRASEDSEEEEEEEEERPVVGSASEEEEDSKENQTVRPVDVTVDASLTGGPAIASAVGYFPSGYDPVATAAGDKSAPSARLFRHEKHPNRVDLVLRSPGGGLDFVGRSYVNEAAAPQLCEYSLGVLDKASGILRVVPIAASKILRLEPQLEVQKPVDSQPSEAASEVGSVTGNDEMNIQDLTVMYGSKSAKDRDKKWRTLNAQRNDPKAYEDLDLGISETNMDSNESQEAVIVQNIPPYDPTADTSEKAYRFDEIIPKDIRQQLLEIVDHFERGEISSNGYGSFVSNRVHKLQGLQGEDKDRLAWILSYITHLLTLLKRNSYMFEFKHLRKDRKESQANKGPATPQAVYRKILLLFTEPGLSSLSTEKNELLINYILVLTLFADDFRSDPTDICADLKMARQKIKPYFAQLGCKYVSTGPFKPSFVTLPAPLSFPKQATRKRQRRR